jgi:ATP-dependent Clp protease ATP-binding subunit ClpA
MGIDINKVYHSWSWQSFPALEKANPSELKKKLESFFQTLLREERVSDPVMMVDRISRELSLQKIFQMCEEDIPKTVQEMRGLFSEAKRYLELVDGSISWNVKSLLLQIMDMVVRVIETIINTFGIGSLFEPADNEWVQDIKNQKLFIFLTLFLTVSSTILPLLGAVVAAEVLGGFFLAIVILGLIWPHIKPMPNYLPGKAENWTQLAKEGLLEAEGRKDSIDKIARILKVGRHALLVGKTGVGKTITAKALVQAIERGEYPELKGKKVFYLKTPDLVNQRPPSMIGGGNNILYDIAVAMGRHKEDIILILDEIHAACKKEALLAEQLKVFLDKGGKFSHVIGITTDEEIKEFEKNSAFMRRFDCIEIENTKKEESLAILRNIAIKLGGVVQEKALQKIYEGTKKQAQPYSSIELLKRCIERTASSQLSSTERRISEISGQILNGKSRISGNFGRISRENHGQLDSLYQELSKLETSLKEEISAKEKLFQAKQLLQEALKAVYRKVVQGKFGEKEFKKSVMTLGILIPFLERYLQEESARLGVQAIVDETLVESMLKN